MADGDSTGNEERVLTESVKIIISKLTACSTSKIWLL